MSADGKCLEPRVIKAVFFDLDYTLYDMEQYLRGAYRDVARSIAEAVSGDADSLLRSLWAVWRRVGSDYGRLFDDWLVENGLFSQSMLQRCIATFHAHRPSLSTYPGLEATL